MNVSLAPNAALPPRPSTEATPNRGAEGSGANSEADASGLTEAEQAQVRELAAIDQRVRAHEAAHVAAAGDLARGGPSFTYQRGPDNRQYAVAGEVQIDTSAVPGDPEATLEKAQRIRRAALAPADPSAQDQAVAASAARMAIEARAEMAAERRDADETEGPTDADTDELETSDTQVVTCPACGGAHAGHAHEGLSAYADTLSALDID